METGESREFPIEPFQVADVIKGYTEADIAVGAHFNVGSLRDPPNEAVDILRGIIDAKALPYLPDDFTKDSQPEMLWKKAAAEAAGGHVDTTATLLQRYWQQSTTDHRDVNPGSLLDLLSQAQENLCGDLRKRWEAAPDKSEAKAECYSQLHLAQTRLHILGRLKKVISNNQLKNSDTTK